MVISFSHETAWRQLVEENEVVTFRHRRRKNPNCSTWCNRGRGQSKEFDVEIEEIGRVVPVDEQLQEYVAMSGFEDTVSWINAIKELNGSIPDKGWLYRVTPSDTAQMEPSSTPI